MKIKKALTAVLGILVLAVIAGLFPYYYDSTNTISLPYKVTRGNFTILKSFDGVSGPGYKDHPDTSGAVGPNDVVDFTGSAFVAQSKTTGAILKQETQSEFWTNAGVAPGTINDPRIIYDPLSSRRFAVESAPYDMLAVSTDSDPTHAWKAVILTKAVSGDLLERVGVDVNGVYMCSFENDTASLDAICFAIPKKDVLWSGTQSLSLIHMTTFPHLPFETFPASDFNPDKSSASSEVFLTSRRPKWYKRPPCAFDGEGYMVGRDSENQYNARHPDKSFLYNSG